MIATAALATGAGFLVLLLSPIPMVRGFGLLLVAGIAIAFALALTAGLAALSLTKRRGSAADPAPANARPPLRRERLERVSRARADLGARLADSAAGRVAVSVAAPGRVLAVGLVVALVGWGAGTQTEIVSDIRELVPRELPELQDVDELQDATGVSGEVDVTVTADDITDPGVIAWMSDYKARVLARAGFGAESRCLDAETQLCPSIALTDLFGESDTAPTKIASSASSICCPPTSPRRWWTVSPRTAAAARPR